MAKKRFVKKAVKKVPKSVKSYVKRQITAENEIKNYVVAVAYAEASASTDTDGSFTRISSMAQGVTDVTRVGNEIKMKELNFNFYIRPFKDLTAATTTPNIEPTQFRIIIFADKQGNTAAPATTDLLTVADPLSPYSIARYNERRFTILYDRLFVMDPILGQTGSTTTDVARPGVIQYGESSYIVSQRRRKYNMKLCFEGPADTESTKNTIWLFLISDQVQARAPLFEGYFQTIFTDS